MNKMNLHQNIINRFWNKVNKIEGQCWNWNAGCSGNGYGLFSYINNEGNQIRVGSHRFSWEYFYGMIQNDLLVLHRCDNKICVNPVHLFLGTPKDNSSDMSNKDRQKGGWAPGSKHINTHLTEENVLEIKKYLKQGYYQKDIAEYFGITQTSVSRIKLGKTWSHI